MNQTSVVEQILDLARWAPSGDNSQPWRFEIIDAQHFVIHGRDTRDNCIYDLDGRPSQLSLGALIETATIAASGHGLALLATRRANLPDTRPTFDVRLSPQPALIASPLIAAIPARRVQRRCMSTSALTPAQSQTLAASVGPDYEVHWFATIAERLQWAHMLWQNAGLRLRLPEAFDLHRRIIQWDARFSPDRIPDQALGVDRLTLTMMRQAMASWQRLDFLNTWLGGTIAPRIMMDWLPAVACAAHVAILARQVPTTVDDHVAAGRAIQRFWLTATHVGLQHQPAITPLVFARYLREGRPFTTRTSVVTASKVMADNLDQLLAGMAASAIWLGRIGAGSPAISRSERLKLGVLLASPKPKGQ